MWDATPETVIIGIDAGTTAIKSVAFRPDGTVAAAARRGVEVVRETPFSSEADMLQVWDLARETLREVIAALPDARLLAIGVTGQGDGAWLIDAGGAPVGPATLWNDGRSADIVERWESSHEGLRVREATGSAAFPGALPAIWQRMRAAGFSAPPARHVNCKDWIRFHLVGAHATDPSEASRTYLDTSTGRYSASMLEGLNHEDIAGLLAPLLGSHEVAGTLRPELMDEFGLTADVPVCVGAVDIASSGIGLGTIADHESFVVLGTTTVAAVNQPSAAARAHPESILLRTGRGNQVVECLAQMSGMPNLEWARTTLGLTSFNWRELEEAINTHAPEPDGVLFLPYSSPSGERAPFRDIHASAAWIGAYVTTSKWSLMRAAYVGVVHAVYESLLGLGLGSRGAPAPITVGGGGAQSQLICRLLADLSGQTVIRQVDSEVGARGAAALALASVTPGADLAAAIHHLAPATEQFAPNPSRRGAAEEGFDVFRSVRDALRPQWPRLHGVNPASHEPES